MNLLLGASAIHYRDEVASLLQQVGISPVATLDLIGEQELSQATESLANNLPAIVLYAPMDLALEQAINEGVPVEQAITSWQQHTAQLVLFYKQHRGKVLMANLEEVFAAPQAFVDACRLCWPELTVNVNAPITAEIKPDPFFQLLAHTLFTHSAALQTLSQQLAALAQPLSDQDFDPTLLPVNINLLVNHYQKGLSALQQLPVVLEQQASSQSQLKTLKEKLEKRQQLLAQEQQDHTKTKKELNEKQQENQLFLNQLFSVQEELESRLQNSEEQASNHLQKQQALTQQLEQEQQAHTKTKKEYQSQINQLQKQIKTLKIEKSQEKQKLEDKQKENQLLLEQLFTVQEELESRLQEHDKQVSHHQHKQQALEKQLQMEQQAHAKAKLEHQNQLKQLQKQLSTLQQEQEDAKKKLAERQTAVQEQQQENKLLLEQLFNVQEELEKYYLAARKEDEQQDPTGLAASGQQQTRNAKTSLLKQQLQKRADQKALRRKLADLYSSPLFDAKWYLAQYPDVAIDEKFRKNPALHYLKFGGFEGRNPSPNFDSAAYLSLNPDVRAEGFNPLLHYLRFGQAENRRTG
ncbi:hypothetical protein [Zobellella sp. An-6]|uniref:hypothetical protein n=1 Tax=Zobellella sp. An-6 TaxID=3400218 RepID=UPI004042F730